MAGRKACRVSMSCMSQRKTEYTRQCPSATGYMSHNLHVIPEESGAQDAACVYRRVCCSSYTAEIHAVTRAARLCRFFVVQTQTDEGERREAKICRHGEDGRRVLCLPVRVRPREGLRREFCSPATASIACVGVMRSVAARGPMCSVKAGRSFAPSLPPPSRAE